jgi:hypothetical protein
MTCDKPILVLVSHPDVVLFSMTNTHTSALNSGIVLLTKVVHAELGIMFEHNLDIWIGMDRSCVATAFSNLDFEHQKIRVKNPTIFRIVLTRLFRHVLGMGERIWRVVH